MRKVYIALVMAAGFGCGGGTEFSSANRDSKKSSSQGAEKDPNSPEGGTPGIDPAAARHVEKTFAVSEVKQAEVQVDASLGAFEEAVTLRRNTAPVTKTFTQIDRPIVTKLLQQGRSGTAMTQVFSQKDKGILDIQIVIDNSGSMSDEQAKLAPNLVTLLDEVKDADWRINIVTTDYKNGCSRAIINKSDTNAAAAFKAAITGAGISGSGNEEGIRMAVAGLDAGRSPRMDSGVSCGLNSSWLRSNSSIAVLIVSDEDNCSNGSGCSSSPWNTHTYLTNYLTTKLGRQLGTNARIYGLYWKPGASCSGAASVANQYNSAVTASSGTAGSICDASYLSTLQSISRDMAKILMSQFQLTAPADANSVFVKVNGVAKYKDTDWTTADTTLTFKLPPTEAAQIEVSYTTGAKARFNSIDLGAVPALDTLQVLVNGEPLVSSGYQVDTAKQLLTFAKEPAENAAINVSFRKAGDLLKEVSLGGQARKNVVEVFIDDVPSSDFTYDPTGKVIFGNPPRDGSSIKVSFDMLLDRILSYPLTLAGSSVSDVYATDAATGELVTTTYANGVLTIPEAEHQDERGLRVFYRNETSTTPELDLPADPLAGTLHVAASDSDCSLDNGVTQIGRKLMIGCQLSPTSLLTISYSYETKPLQEFTLPDVAEPEQGMWVVKIDGIATTAYQRTGATVTLNEVPDAKAKVSISYSLANDE